MAAITITITVKEDCLEELKTGFLKWVIRPEKYQHLTDIQFFKQWIEDNIQTVYSKGKEQIAQETTTPVIIEDIVEVT